MDPLNALILLVAGACGGFIAGLAGVGGGIVFAPVLFYFFQATGTAPAVLAPMTVGTSLLCTLAASSVSAWQHSRRTAVNWAIALRVGTLSAVALYVVVAFVTTKPWYDRFAFQLVFGGLLLVVAVRMFVDRRPDARRTAPAPLRAGQPSLLTLGGIGSAAGTIAGLAGVGGGIIMVPAYHQILRLPMRTSVGTSSGAIVVISLIGVAGYVVSGWSKVPTLGTFGFVDVSHGLLLALAAVPAARIGAGTAHRIPRSVLRIAFAAIAGLVACRMLFTALAHF